jgi:hypothetical protein
MRHGAPMLEGPRGAFDGVTAVNDRAALRVLKEEPGHRDLVRFVRTLIHLDVMQLQPNSAAFE